MILITTALLLATSCGAAAEERSPPIVAFDDFGDAPNWRGLWADGSTVRYETELKDWSRTAPGGLATDSAVLYGNKPAGRLLSLKRGYLAFRPTRFRKNWDSIEFALHNTTSGTASSHVSIGEIRTRNGV